MKLGKRCSLCGGRLDSTLRCTECGLDNTKSDDMYKHLINQNDCQDEPLTHVHEEPKINKNYGKVTYTYKNNVNTVKPSVNRSRQSAKSSKKKGSLVGIVVIIIILFTTIIPAIITLIGNLAFHAGIREEVIPEYIGEQNFDHEYYLAPGFYEVGVHIPEGDYEVALLNDGYGWLDVYEFDGNTFIMKDYCSFDSEDDTRYLLTLEQKDFVVISDNSLSLCTSSDTFNMETGMEIEAEESFYIEAGAVAGEDFPAGVYDIYFEPVSEDEWGQVDIKLSDTWRVETMWEYSLFFDSYVGESCFLNVPFTAGSQITVDDSLLGVTLIPSYIVGNEMYAITWGQGDIPIND